MLNNVSRDVEPCIWSDLINKKRGTGTVLPVIKNLAPKNVPSHSPTVSIPFQAKPVMTESLRIVIVNLEAGVVWENAGHPGICRQKEALFEYAVVSAVHL
jgi:hypothetical protein